MLAVRTVIMAGLIGGREYYRRWFAVSHSSLTRDRRFVAD